MSDDTGQLRNTILLRHRNNYLLCLHHQVMTMDVQNISEMLGYHSVLTQLVTQADYVRNMNDYMTLLLQNRPFRINPFISMLLPLHNICLEH